MVVLMKSNPLVLVCDSKLKPIEKKEMAAKQMVGRTSKIKTLFQMGERRLTRAQ